VQIIALAEHTMFAIQEEEVVPTHPSHLRERDVGLRLQKT